MAIFTYDDIDDCEYIDCTCSHCNESIGIACFSKDKLKYCPICGEEIEEVLDISI